MKKNRPIGWVRFLDYRGIAHFSYCILILYAPTLMYCFWLSDNCPEGYAMKTKPTAVAVGFALSGCFLPGSLTFCQEKP